MLRLFTNEGTRITEVNSFKVHYGGSEANVAINLANFNHQVSFASKVPKKFERVLEDAGVYKVNKEGKVGFEHFIKELQNKDRESMTRCQF
ncbi:hypothetical protein IEQ_04887 [Bacillus cereus BAG6X1-2]|nr:hypothetical protein IEQ_04887 [Bacillus cereus BAG6X1-2]